MSKWENTTTNEPKYQYIDISDLEPVLIGESSYVPLRVISEAFGAIVDWEDITRTVVIACDTSNTYKYDAATIANMEDFTLDVARAYITDDFSSVVQYNTPYYAPECKFYLFDAKDQWGDVTLRVNYGGYIDVIAKPVAEAVTENTPVIEATTPVEEIADESAVEILDTTDVTNELLLDEK